ncbi:4'-phosphopantetheinyl transferase family protein [Streptomyces sp. NPDC050529]|uniref:4'-phosphopantetheinyl transferase family protein n=1 Tax=unclassified Streptomyces TaxID=2593676 RepID=UPI002DDA11D7|nr:4'-phosphopantetheinyl transferase superfamily protein [Streptomyces sp. NBC_01022]WRZ87490.1 4'-phosphopantetheinyl transferase superfamily protein [Streptomyces sp. NBC_01022]
MSGNVLLGGSAGPGEPGRPAPVKLWFCTNEELAAEFAETLADAWLDAPERELAERFLFEQDRHQYVIAHLLVRRVLALETGVPESEAVIWRSTRGRPFFRRPPEGMLRGGHKLDFNLSHTHGHNLLGMVRAHRIGVDVERLDRGARGLNTIVDTFAPQERHWVTQVPPGRPRDRRVLRLWTLKEAYSKALGLGLGLPFDSFVFELAEDDGVLGFQPPDNAVEGAQQWRFLELEPAPDILAAVAVIIDPGAPAVLQLYHGFPWSRGVPQLIALPEPARILV